MAYKANSLSSTSSSFSGPTARIWRHSSLPIDPPAPVTKTTLLMLFLDSRRWLGLTGSRPSRSSTSKSRTSLRLTLPVAMSLKPGKVRTAILWDLSASRISLRRLGETEGKAKSTSVIGASAKISAKSAGLWIGKPFSKWPCRRSSSSK